MGPYSYPEGWHSCHFCSTLVNEEGYELSGERHFLSDCRPDLVEHEIGETCTWSYRREPQYFEYTESDTCYAYQDKDFKWTDEHKHFYEDGPM